MAVLENADVEMVDSSGHKLDNNTASLGETMQPPCPDDHNPKSNSSVERPNQKTSEVPNLRSEISHSDDKLSKLNPMAREFVPHSGFLRNRLCFTNNFATQAISADENHYHFFATRGRNFGQGKRWMNKKTSLAHNENVIRRTVHVSDIDQQVTEEKLAGLFLSCGQVVDCRICGDSKSILRFAFIEFTDEEGARSALRISGTVFGSHPIRVLLSKTAIAPVNPIFLPRSEDEQEKCVKTVYCTNIDKKIRHLRLLGDYHHQTRIAFVEFTLAESAISALNCSGVVLGRLPLRVSPSKTPVRPHCSDLN